MESVTPRDKKPKLGMCPEARKWPSIQNTHIGYLEKPRNRIDWGWPMCEIQRGPIFVNESLLKHS